MLEYNVYGSKSSTDVDLAIKVNEKVIKQPKHIVQELRQQYIQQLQPQFEKPLNINLVHIENGIVSNTFIGLPDELNNALYKNYPLHNQTYPCFVKKLVERNIAAKVERMPMVILTYLSRFQLYRKEIKAALRSGDVNQMINILKIVIKTPSIQDYLEHIDLYKRMSIIEVLKKLTFQIRQTLLLIDGIEIYSKEEILNLNFIPTIEKEIILRHQVDGAVEYIINLINLFLDYRLLVGE